MKSKLKFVIPVLLLAAGGVYKFVLSKPAAVAKPKVAGEVYVLPKEFMLNLEGGRFAKLGVALVMKAGAHMPAAAGGGGHGSAAPKPPDGYGLNPQEALVRGIVTEVVTGAEPDELQSKKGRKKLQKEILTELKHKTDVKAAEVVFTDVAVQ